MLVVRHTLVLSAFEETLILAEIWPCKVLSCHKDLDIHYYKNYGTPLVFDITCIQILRVMPFRFATVVRTTKVDPLGHRGLRKFKKGNARYVAVSRTNQDSRRFMTKTSGLTAVGSGADWKFWRSSKGRVPKDAQNDSSRRIELRETSP